MANPITIDDVLNKDIFSLLGMESMSDTDKEEFLSSMNDTVQLKLLLAISQELSPEDNAKMEGLEGEELGAFLEAHGIDLVGRLLEEAIKYRYELATAFQIATTPAPASALAAAA